MQNTPKLRITYDKTSTLLTKVLSRSLPFYCLANPAGDCPIGPHRLRRIQPRTPFQRLGRYPGLIHTCTYTCTYTDTYDIHLHLRLHIHILIHTYTYTYRYRCRCRCRHTYRNIYYCISYYSIVQNSLV